MGDESLPQSAATSSGKTHAAGRSNASGLTNFDTILGRLVVEKGLASESEVQELLDLRNNRDLNQQSLGDLLVENGIITTRQLQRLRPLVEESKPTQQIPGYQVLEKLGAGAMATVYKAKQLSLDRVVAIKVLPKRYTNNTEFVERFYAEGRAAAKLNHPNIVQAIDVGKAGEYNFFVMEYVQGQTVFDMISSGRRFKERDALEIVLQITRALDHAHKAGFIHRDVKPKNIMLTSAGVAKLADMGLARAVSDVEAAEAEAGKAYGTPYYIAPEQIRGEVDIDFRSDIYSLGATFYHMVTGQVPFDGPNPSAVMHKHLKSELTPPDRINPKLSTGLCEIIEICMAKDRKQRYNSTSDLLTDLEAVARGEAPIQARQKFDIGKLSVLAEGTEIKPEPEPDVQSSPADKKPPLMDPTLPYYYQPLFYVALTGWVVAFVLFVAFLAASFK
ncbi:MAG: serine/threonine protein kinase [Phycisphaerales bacterium]|nr:serine/threonine protein kinase [Phycisphaerales bacterium]